jgi:predicted HTH transcriptional regulator
VDTELHLPWRNEALQALMLEIIQRGEATKADFKSQLNIATSEHHAELLKDISALANTYDYPYRNHGFIILGVAGNKLTYTKFEQTPDALQATIDDLIKKNIEPFIPTQVRIFGTGAEIWGVIVVPPTRTAPHVFTKDICKRYRGDIYVRRGTTTDKAASLDYIRFFRQHLDEHTYEIREQLEKMTWRL